MYTFYYQDLVFSQLERDIVILALFRFKVEMRHIGRFAPNKSGKMIVEQFKVNGFYVLIVRIAILVTRIPVFTHKIIIHRKCYRPESVNFQMSCEPFGKCSFARRRWTRDKNHAYRFFCGINQVGNMGELLFVQSFRGSDKWLNLIGHDNLVQRSSRCYAKYTPPFLMLLENMEKMLLIHERR